MTTEYTPTPQDLKTVQAPNVADQLGASLAAADEALRTALGNPSDKLAQEQAFALKTTAESLTAQQTTYLDQKAYVEKQNAPVEAALRAQNDKQTNALMGDLAKVGLTAAFMNVATNHGVAPVVALGAGMGMGGLGLIPRDPLLVATTEERRKELAETNGPVENKETGPKTLFNSLRPVASMAAFATAAPVVMMAMSPFSLFNSRSQKPEGLEGPQLDLAATGPTQKPEPENDGGATGLAMATRLRPRPSPMMEMSFKPSLITPLSKG